MELYIIYSTSVLTWVFPLPQRRPTFSEGIEMDTRSNDSLVNYIWIMKRNMNFLTSDFFDTENGFTYKKSLRDFINLTIQFIQFFE